MANMHALEAIVFTHPPSKWFYPYLNGLDMIDMPVALKRCHRLQIITRIALPFITNSCGFWVLCHKLHFDVLLSQALMS